MLPAIVIGGGLSYLFSRVLAGDGPGGTHRPPAPRVPPPPPTQPDAHMEARTRAGLERLLMGGTADQLDQAANSLLRSGYPLAAQMCAVRAAGMRRFDEERKAANLQRERAMAAQAAHAQAQAQALAAANAQADAIAAAATQMHALAAQKGNVPPAPEPATVAVALLPVPVPVAPPTNQGAEGAPVSKSAKSGVRKRAPKAKLAVVPQHVNGRATSEH